MFGLGTSEIILILVVALILLGPKRLPEIARTLGRGLAEFRRATSDIKESIESEYHAALDDHKAPIVKRSYSKASLPTKQVPLPDDDEAQESMDSSLKDSRNEPEPVAQSEPEALKKQV